MRRLPPFSALLLALLLAACGPDADDGVATSSVPLVSSASGATSAYPQPDWDALPGALVKTTLESTVGVLLDGMPAADADRLASQLLQESEAFWTDRAKRQIRLTSLHLNFRAGGQLPLPPEELWDVRVTRQPQRETVQGHDLVTVRYAYEAILLTDAASPGISEEALDEPGGAWEQPFVFPIDPELIFQRTGYACFNESQFPPNSVDAEEADLFYDFECRAQKTLSNTTCHQTQLVDRSCVDAVRQEIGSVATAVRYERLPWDASVADGVRTGEVTNPDGPDLKPYAEGFREHRFTYRYISPNSCTLIEKCVGGPGWRKLLMFPTGDVNVGTRALDIGIVDYFGKSGGSELSRRGVFEFSACHRHYHFSQYGTFSLEGGDEALTRKNGFCLQPSARMANNELSPLQHKYVDCVDQGVAVGWIDEYKMGLECQWIDVTDVPERAERTLSFVTNPTAFLCEGEPVKDEDGNQAFEPSELKTTFGQTIERPVCDQFPGWDANNRAAYGVTVPRDGRGYVTEPCATGVYGEMRNCGFTNATFLMECEPGKKASLRCDMPQGGATHVVRVCEGSRALGAGIPCTYNDALASVLLDGETTITFTCPEARDGAETGGAFSFMAAPLLPTDEVATVSCKP